jgi:hypothetical protein
MEDNLRVTKLREYLFSIIETLNEHYEQININFLSNEIDNYSLDKIPVQKEVERWITGITINHDIYSFRSRMNYSADVLSNISNIGFFEEFEKIIKEKNNNKDLPDIEGIQAIRCLNCGTMNHAGTNTAEFDIQIEIDYMEV